MRQRAVTSEEEALLLGKLANQALAECDNRGKTGYLERQFCFPDSTREIMDVARFGGDGEAK